MVDLKHYAFYGLLLVSKPSIPNELKLSQRFVIYDHKQRIKSENTNKKALGFFLFHLTEKHNGLW